MTHLGIRTLTVSVCLIGCLTGTAGAQTIAAGVSHTVVVKPDGTVSTFGLNNNGQLGDNSQSTRKTPIDVSGLTDVIAVAAGAYHSLALTSGGAVYAWGDNAYYQLGDSTNVDKWTPTVISLSGVVAIAAGEYHSMALLSNGDLYTWGRNASGQLGIASTTNATIPTFALANVAAIGAGFSHSLAVKTDGTAWAAGLNTNGQLGDTTTNSPLTSFVQMSGISGASRVAGGRLHSVILLTNGTLKATGYGGIGQIGDGNWTQRTSAVAVSTLTNVTALAAGADHAIALKSDGTVWAWGYDGYGQLGDDSGFTHRNTPVQVSSLSSVAKIGTGHFHSIAVDSSGVVSTWGSNGSGELGDGTTTSRATPLAISGTSYVWNVGTPVFSVTSGTYNTDRTVVVTEDTAGATIHYTLNGDEPTESDPTIASGGSLTISSTQTLKAKAWKSGLNPSVTASATYTMQVGTPSFSPSATTYTTPQTVTITTVTPGTTIRYTTDDSTPTEASPAYTVPLSVSTTTKLKAIGFKSGWSNSAMQQGTYTMSFGTLTAPTLTPTGGTYESSVTVTMTSSQPGAVVRYTTNDTAPTQSSTLYTAPLAIETTTKIRAKAFHPDYTTSPETIHTYTIAVAPPTFTPTSGTYTAGQSVTIASATPGATIRYTINGADPTTTSPTIGSGGTITIGNFTLKAKAWKSGATESAVTSATYSITGNVATAMVAAGGDYSLAVRHDGVAFGWGQNWYGEVGDGTTTNPRPLPRMMAGITGVARVEGGTDHTLILRTNGTVYAVGRNANGRLGDGTTNNQSLPIAVPGLSTIGGIAAGDTHSVALKSDGTIVGWGANNYGQIGDGTSNNDRPTPTAVSNVTNATAIGAGQGFTLALTQSGSVYAWGYNMYGRLGNGNTTNQPTPVALSGLTTATAIAAGYEHGLAVLSDGTVRAWGRNGSGQLGDNSTTDRSSPVAVQNVTGAVAVAAGWGHSLVLKSDGTVWAFGFNQYGQLGDGTPTQRNTATQVPALTNIVAIAAGRLHSLALDSDGVVWVWGRNAAGQLGDGTTADRFTPFAISGAGLNWRVPTPTISLASGTYFAAQSTTITNVDAEATIRYTTDGTDPTSSSATFTSGGTLAISQSTTLKVSAWKTGFLTSAVAVRTYELKVPAPTLSLATNTYTTDQSVTVTSSLAGTTLRYTTSGVDPTESDPTIASGGTVGVGQTLTLKVAAWKSGWTTSTVTAATYTMKVGTASVSPGAGSYTSAQTVTVSSVTSGATLRYTLTGREPVASDSIVASGGTVNVNQSTTLKVKGTRAGWVDSDTAAATYLLTLGTAAPPTMNPAAGSYTTSQTVALSTTTPGATIRYTVDGTEPGFASPVYAAPLTIAHPTTLKARAFKADWTASATTTADYTFTNGSMPAPVLSPPGGEYATSTTVTVSTPTSGATLRYTLNGLDPTEQDPTIASGATLTFNASARLRVRAFHATLGASGITTADYWILGAIAAGGYHTVALKADGTVWAWGDNQYGAIGDGTQTDRTAPASVSGLTNVVAVAAGRWHTLAVKRDGTVWSWGYNGSGQLGDNSTTMRLTPVPVSGLTDVIAVAAGQTHSLALKKDGTVWRWGDNQLVPVQVTGLSGVSRIAASNSASIALRTDGALSGSAWTWGGNTFGQLGDGTTMPRSAPQPIIAEIIAIGAGEDHMFAIQADGTPWAWGVNGAGRLGDGTTISPRYTPVKTLDLAAVTIAGGSDHSIARGTDGSAWTWGHGVNAGLPDLSGNFLELPQRTPGAGNDVANVAAGLDHSIASRRDGSLWSWGRNEDGQLGVGDTSQRQVPTQIPNFSLTDPTWLLGDQDGDGLLTWQEFDYGSDPVNPDTNGDGLLDGAAAASGKSLLNADMDADGVTNLIERSRGTDPFRVDSDGDTYSDGVDAFPLDPARWDPPAPIPGDTTPPVITLTYPTTAVPVPPL